MNRSAVLFLLFVVPFLSVALAYLGWRTLPTNPTGAFLLFTGVVYSLGIPWMAYRRRGWLWNPKNAPQQEERGDRSFWLLLPGFLAVFFLSPIEFLAAPETLPRSAALPWVGLALIAAGILLFSWARRCLRSSYTGHLAVSGAQVLVQSGAYRTIRHPAYLAGLLMSLGVALGYSSLLGLLATALLLVPGLAYRIRVEERLLEDHFGDEYRRYRAHTTRLLPGIW